MIHEQTDYRVPPDRQQGRARELEHRYNGFLEQVHGDVRGLIDDDNVSAGSAGRLRG